MAPMPPHEEGRNVQRNFWLHLFILLSLTIAPASCAGPQAIQEYPTTLRCPDCPMMKVTRVIDGDTFVSNVGGVRGRVRLFGVDTPEQGMPCFREASWGFRQLAGGEIRVNNGWQFSVYIHLWMLLVVVSV